AEVEGGEDGSEGSHTDEETASDKDMINDGDEGDGDDGDEGEGDKGDEIEGEGHQAEPADVDEGDSEGESDYDDAPKRKSTPRPTRPPVQPPAPAARGAHRQRARESDTGEYDNVKTAVTNIQKVLQEFKVKPVPQLASAPLSPSEQKIHDVPEVVESEEDYDKPDNGLSSKSKADVKKKAKSSLQFMFKEDQQVDVKGKSVDREYTQPFDTPDVIMEYHKGHLAKEDHKAGLTPKKECYQLLKKDGILLWIKPTGKNSKLSAPVTTNSDAMDIDDEVDELEENSDNSEDELVKKMYDEKLGNTTQAVNLGVEHIEQQPLKQVGRPSRRKVQSEDDEDLEEGSPASIRRSARGHPGMRRRRIMKYCQKGRGIFQQM
ncbi:hypothetical protein HDU93_009659, partial [Gonapodya sp. JEL0774]